ncbi:acyl carrier protein [Candidatus Pacearchaeota archaeon]|nr:acyl carrier protein [Candidatus Pacearchaeota archaeon]
MELEQQIKEKIAKELDCKIEEVRLESTLREDLGADSLKVLELAMFLEDEYSLKIQDEELDKIKTVGHVVDYIKKHYKVQ